MFKTFILGRKSSNKRRPLERRYTYDQEEKWQGYIAKTIIGIGVSLSIWGIILTEDMFIPASVLWLAMLVGTAIASIIIFLAWRKNNWGIGKGWFVVIILFYGILAGAPVPFWGINAINYYVKGDEIVEKVMLDITDTGRHSRRHSSKCGSIYVVVKLKGIKHDISFSCEYEHTIAQYKKVNLTLTKGGLGYYMIVDKSLVGIEE